MQETTYREKMAEVKGNLGKGPGGGRFLGFLNSVLHSVVTFFVAVFRALVSVASQPKSRTRPGDESDGSQQNKNNIDDPNQTVLKNRRRHHLNSSTSTISHDGDHDSPRMQPSLQTPPLAATKTANEPREVNANANANANANGQPKPAAPVKVALPRTTGLPNGIAKQENQPTKSNGGAADSAAAAAVDVVVVKAAEGRDLANGPKGAVFRAVGEEQAQENRQEYITLPPVDDEVATEPAEDEPEDPALAAERAIHHGFMNQALDMVCSSSFVSCLLLSRPVRLALFYATTSDFFSIIRLFAQLCQGQHQLSCLPRAMSISFCRRVPLACCSVSNLLTPLHHPPPSYPQPRS